MQIGHAYTQQITISNPHDAPVTVTLKCSAASRYQVSPAGALEIAARGQVSITVRLKVDAFPNRMRGTRGQRDSFQLKGTFFEQKFFSTFYLQKEMSKTSSKRDVSKVGNNTASRRKNTNNTAAGLLVPHADVSVSTTAAAARGTQPHQVRVHRTGSVTVMHGRGGAGNNTNQDPRSMTMDADSSHHEEAAMTEQQHSLQKWLHGELGQIMAALIQRRSLYGLTLASLTEMFRMTDPQNIGAVSRRDFHATMQRLDLGLSVQQVDVLLNAMDADQAGDIMYNDFVRVMDFCESPNGGATSTEFLAQRLRLAEEDAQQILQLSSSTSTSSAIMGATMTGDIPTEADYHHHHHHQQQQQQQQNSMLDHSYEDEERSQRVLSVLEAKDRVIGGLQSEIARLMDSKSGGSGTGGAGGDSIRVVGGGSMIDVRRLQEENASFSSLSASAEQRILELERDQERLEEELRNARRLPTNLRERAERAEEEASRLRKTLADSGGKPSSKLVEDAMLSKIDDLEQSLERERTTSSSLRSDCERMRKELKVNKEDNVRLNRERKEDATLIEHLRVRQTELEEMQSTAQETVMDAERRLESAMERLTEHEALTSSSSVMANGGVRDAGMLAEAAVETARKEANDLRSRLRLTEADLDTLRRRRDVESRMRDPYGNPKDSKRVGEVVEGAGHDADENSTGAHQSTSSRDSTLSTVRRLESVIEEQALSIVELRQSIIRSGMESRQKLRIVEEDCSQRNNRIAMLQSALRQKTADRRTTTLERTVRSLRRTSGLHEELAVRSEELAAMERSCQHVMHENEELKKLAQNARDASHQSKLEVDSLHLVMADLQSGFAAVSVPGMTPERLATLLASEHAKRTSDIENLRIELSGMKRAARRGGGVIRGDIGGSNGSSGRQSRSQSRGRSRSPDGRAMSKPTTFDRHMPISGLVPPPTIDLDGTEYRQGLSRTHGAILSRSDMDIPTLKARQLEMRLESSEDECQSLYREVHTLREQLMDVEERHGRQSIDIDALHTKQLRASNSRMAVYVAETHTIREELSKCEYRVRDLEGKRIRLEKRARKRRRDEVGAQDEGSSNVAATPSFSLSSNAVIDRVDYLRLERSLKQAETKEDDAKRALIRCQHALEERNQHVTVLTETIDALQSTTSGSGGRSSNTADRIAQELERQAAAQADESGNESGNEDDDGQFDGTIQEMLRTTTEEDALRSRVVVLTAQTIRAQTSTAQLRAHAETLEHMVERGCTTQRRLEEKLAISLGLSDRRSEDLDRLEEELEKERTEAKGLNDVLLSMDRKMQSMKLDVETMRLQLEITDRERNATEKTLRATQTRHLRQSREEYEENEKVRKTLMAQIVTLRVTVATMHASGISMPSNGRMHKHHATDVTTGGTKLDEEKSENSSGSTRSDTSDLLALAEYVDVEDLVHRRSAVAVVLSELKREVISWTATSRGGIMTPEEEEQEQVLLQGAGRKLQQVPSNNFNNSVANTASTTSNSNEQRRQLLSLQFLVEGLMVSIEKMDRAMLEAYRDARVSRWELSHCCRKRENLEEYAERKRVEQWLPSELLKVERNANHAKATMLSSLSNAEADTLRSRITAYQEHLRASNQQVLAIRRQRDKWKGECLRWKKRSQRERAEESQSRVGSRLVSADRALRRWEEEAMHDAPQDSTFWNHLKEWVVGLWREEEKSLLSHDGNNDEEYGTAEHREVHETVHEKERRATGRLIVRLTRELLALRAMREGDDARREHFRTTLNELRLSASSADDDLDAVKMMSNVSVAPNKSGRHSGGGRSGSTSTAGGDVSQMSSLGGGRSRGGENDVAGDFVDNDDNDDGGGDALSMLAERLCSDARMEESHARQDDLSRLERSLREAQHECQQLQEWKEMSMAREERLRIDHGSEVQRLRLEVARTTGKESEGNVLSTVGAAREIQRLRSAYAALQMKYDRDLEAVRLVAVRSSKKDQKDENTSDVIDVNALMAEKYTLEDQLRERKAIESARKSAFEELEGKIVDIARRSLGGAHARTRGGKTIDPSEELAKELIQSKIAISECRRQMRVMARTETELRDTVEKREAERTLEREQRRQTKQGKNNNPHSRVDSMTPAAQSKMDQTELVRQLAKSVSHVKTLERELSEYRSDYGNSTGTRGSGSGDVDVRALYEQVSESAAREKRMKVELISTRSELKSLRATLDQIVTGRDPSMGDVSSSTHQKQDLVHSGTNATRRAKEKAIDARITYLENALKTSENQRRRLERMLPPGTGGGDEMPSRHSTNSDENRKRGALNGEGGHQDHDGNDGAHEQRNGGGGGGGATMSTSSSSIALAPQLEEARDEVRRMQIERRQSRRDIENLKKELNTLRIKVQKTQGTLRKQKEKVELENDEERDEWAVKENGYEQRITKLRRTIKSLQENSGDRAAQAEKAVVAMEEELSSQVATIKNQLFRTKKTLVTVREKLRVSQEQNTDSQRQMERSATALEEARKSERRTKEQMQVQAERQVEKQEEQTKTRERVEMAALNNERTMALEREVRLLKETHSQNDIALDRSRHLVSELQTTNQELVQRLKVKGRERSAVEAKRKRETDKKDRTLESVQEECLSLQRMEKHLKSQLREMAETNSELLARLNAHAATSATSRLEARTIRQEAEGLQERMMMALQENEETLDTSFRKETEAAKNKAELSRLSGLVEALSARVEEGVQRKAELEEKLMKSEHDLLLKENLVQQLQSDATNQKLEGFDEHTKALANLTTTMQKETARSVSLERENMRVVRQLEEERTRSVEMARQLESYSTSTATTTTTNNAAPLSMQQQHTSDFVGPPTTVAFGRHSTNNTTHMENNRVEHHQQQEAHATMARSHRDVTERLAMATHSLENMSKELESADSRRRTAEEELSSLKTHVSALTDDVEKTKRARDEEEKKARREREQNDQQRERLVLLDAELHSLRVKHTEDTNRLSARSEEHRASSEALKQQVDALTIERTSNMKLRATKDDEYASVVEEKRTIQQQLKKETRKVASLTNVHEENRLEAIGRLQAIDEETKRRDHAHRQLSSMFEEQVKTLRGRLFTMNVAKHHHQKQKLTKKVKSTDVVITDLQIRLSERDAALKILRKELRELRELQQRGASVISDGVDGTSGSSSNSSATTRDHHRPASDSLLHSMTSLEALDLGVMELRGSRAEAERKHMEIQMTSSLAEMDDLREEVERLQESLDETRAKNTKQKAKTRAVARVAVKKQKTSKLEVVRLREAMDLMRKNWTSPDETKQMSSQLEKKKRKVRSLKNELAARTRRPAAGVGSKTEADLEDATDEQQKGAKTAKTTLSEATAMAEDMKTLKTKMKKMSSEAKRSATSMKELRVLHHEESKHKKQLEQELRELKSKLSDAQKSHAQRKTAIDALREGVSAQRNRVETLQSKLSEQGRLEGRLRTAESERSRLSHELSEAHARYRQSDEKRQQLETEGRHEIDKRKVIEERARQVTDDSDRRVQLAEHRAKNATIKMHGAIVSLGEQLIEDIGKARVRLRSARRSVSIPKDEQEQEEKEKEKEVNNDYNSASTSGGGVQRTEVEEETIANVSAMLDMSANEVEDVLGLNTPPNNNNNNNNGLNPHRTNNNNSMTPPHHHRHHRLPTGTTPMRGVRAQHTMALARLRLALEQDPVDVTVVFDVLNGLIVERAKVEAALVKVHQQFVLERTEEKIRKAESRLHRRIYEEQQQQQQQQPNTTGSSSSSSSSSSTNIHPRHRPSRESSPGGGIRARERERETGGAMNHHHVGREGSPPTVVSTRAAGREAENSNYQASVSLTHLATNLTTQNQVPSNVAVLVGEIKAQMEREHDAAQKEIVQFRARVQDLEHQLATSGGGGVGSGMRTKRTRSGAPTDYHGGRNNTATNKPTTTMVVAELLTGMEGGSGGNGGGSKRNSSSSSSSSNTANDEHLRPLKRAALEQRLQELQRDTSGNDLIGSNSANAESVGRGVGIADTPERAQGVPVPFQQRLSYNMSTDDERNNVVDSSGSTAAPEKDDRASARRGTYYGLCKCTMVVICCFLVCVCCFLFLGITGFY